MDFTPLLEQSNRISAMDVRNFRLEVFADGLVSRAEAEAVFAINNTILEKCPEWSEFFVESLVDYTVHQAQPKGYVSVANAEWLRAQIEHDGHLETSTELELLIKTIERASQCPQSLCTFVLGQIANAVISGDGNLVGDQKLVQGVIGFVEVELLRRVLYAYGGDNGLSISRSEAEILFDLNDATLESQNHPAWSDLFMKAVANHLMAVSGYQQVSRKEALRREAWLEDTQTDVSGMLANSLKSIASLFSISTIADVFQSDIGREEAAWAERNAATEKNKHSAVQIDDAEGVWLAQRIGRDGALHENQRALLNFIRNESPKVHPAIQELIRESA